MTPTSLRSRKIAATQALRQKRNTRLRFANHLERVLVTTVRPSLTIFNVKYSPNLGDGLLSECLEAEARESWPGSVVISLDLAGRRMYGPGGRLRPLKLALLELLSARARAFVAGWVLRRLARTRLKPAWRRQLAGSGAVIIGGGNLFADADLNFPIKIHAALTEANRRRLPVAVHAVGVTPNWSAEGARLFGEGLSEADLVAVAVRDERSRMAWDRLLDPAAVRRAEITVDPGLLTARHFPAAIQQAGAVPHIALGITDPVALRYHGGQASAAMLVDWFGGLIDALGQQPCRISLFTNGSPEDRRFLKRIAPRLIARARNRVSVAPAFARPTDLAAFIAGCDLVMAHRMHACIAAYSYRVPTIGFVWDVKLQSFFEMTDRARYIIDPATMPPEAAADLAFAAMAEGIAPAIHNRLVNRCRRDVAILVGALASVERVR